MPPRRQIPRQRGCIVRVGLARELANWRVEPGAVLPQPATLARADQLLALGLVRDASRTARPTHTLCDASVRTDARIAGTDAIVGGQ